MQVIITQKAAFADGTNKILKIQWELFKTFCTDFNILALPVSSVDLCLYAQFLANRFKAPQSVRNYVNGVKILHILTETPTDAFVTFELKLFMRGMTRIKAHHPKQAQPITVEMLKEMSKVVNQKDPIEITIWAATLVAFFCFLRKSNLVPETVESFDPCKQLLREDIKVSNDLLLVHIKWSKTIQFGGRFLQVPVLAIPGSAICPVKAYKSMTSKVKLEDKSPAFGIKQRRVSTPLLYSKFQSVLRKWVAAAGWDPSLFSSHSLRRGGASLAFKAKVPSDLIKIQGDWASDCYLRYLAIPLEQRIQVACQVREVIQGLE